MQLVTTSSDGLVKLWTIKDEACVKTLDNHEDKVTLITRKIALTFVQIWALAVSSDERTIVSAGADSIATFWEDSTAAEQAEANAALVMAVQRCIAPPFLVYPTLIILHSEQDFTNYLAIKDYRRAITLALAMSQPGRLLSLFTTVLASPTSNGTTTYTGSVEVDEVIRTLRSVNLVRLLGHVRDWNANARTSPVAQGILHAILRLKSPDEILAAFDEAARIPVVPDSEEKAHGEEDNAPRKKPPHMVGLRDLLDGLIPYSERHFARVDRLVQDSYVLDYVVGEMDGIVFEEEVMDVDL